MKPKITPTQKQLLDGVIAGDPAGLLKFEIYKPDSGKVLDHEEIRTALTIVPKSILSLIKRNLKPLGVGEEIEFDLLVDGARMRANKIDRDVYSGEIIDKDNSVITPFQFRSLPGVALVTMSAFELYEVSEVPNAMDSKPEQVSVDRAVDIASILNEAIDEGVRQRRVLEEIVNARINEAMRTGGALNEKSNGKKLSDFLEKKRDKSLKKSSNTFNINISANDEIDCPDCGKTVFNKGAYSGCICLGEDMGSKLFIKKTESGVQVRFPKSWDAENIEMLLSVLRDKTNKEDTQDE